MHALVILTSFILCFVVTFFTIKFSRKIQNHTRDYVPKTDAKKLNIGPFGGIAMFISACTISATYIQDISSLILLIPTFGILILGFIDDLKKILLKNHVGISAKLKLFFQSVITILTCYFLFKINPNFENLKILIPFYGILDTRVPFFISFFISYFAIMGSINAVNLTDGLDGLAGKQVLLLLTFLVIIVLKVDFFHIQYNMLDLSVILCAFIGSIIAFLCFNTSPATIIMGDAGSMALGCLVASIFTMLKLEITLIFVGFIIFMEALSVIMQVIYFKISNGKRIFKMSPIHHHFQLSGMKEQKITEVSFLIALILMITSLSTIF